jgi:hypothetical protein
MNDQELVTMKKWAVIVSILVVVTLVGGAFLLGTLQGSGGILGSFGDGREKVEVPEWALGQYWTYAYDTPDIAPTIAKTVVSTKNAEQYEVGIDNRLEAQRHAVLNYNPFLGRITTDTLGVYENGEVQPVLRFPLEEGRTWKFAFLGHQEWQARVIDIGDDSLSAKRGSILVRIEATDGSGSTLRYSYGTDPAWIRSMVLTGPEGEEELSMMMVSYGSGYKGEVFFVRGVDLFDKEYSSSTGSPSIDVYDSFIDRGHQKWGPFDSLIYFYEVAVGAQSNGLLTIRDHSTTTVLRKIYDPGTEESSLGSMPSSGGEMGVTVVLQGACSLHLMIAGGIEYKWSV